MIGSPRSQKCAQISCCRGRFQRRRQRSENATVRSSTSIQLLFPVVLSAFQPDVGLTLRSVLGARFRRSSFLTNNVFVKMLLFFSVFCTELTACPVSLCHTYTKPCPVFLLKRFISVTKDIKQRERINACCLDEALHFKEDDGCTKKKYTVVFAVCLSFYFISIKCYLVLFLYYQLIVRSFH